MALSDAASITTIAAFFVTLVSIAFSAKRYLDIREKDQESERFAIYHRLLKIISTGYEEKQNDLKLASQLAYIYELRNFPEYTELTRPTLNRLRGQWANHEPLETNGPLKEAIDDTLSYLERIK
jgi:hypothetical protein